MYKFLLIEDSESDIEAFQTTIKRMNYGEESPVYELEIAKTYDEGMSKIRDNYNGAIVDINLDSHSGNEIVAEIIEKYRLPVAIFTGTPDTMYEGTSHIMVYKKGEASQEDIIIELCEVSDTGLFSVLGGTGIIEKVMTQVFWKNLYPQIELWKEKKRCGVDTERILLRYAISHIQELMDSEIPSYVTEEMYIVPPVTKAIRTGGIYQSSKDKMNCIVLSPPCDLAVHNGKMKTDRILVCEIEKQDDVLNGLINTEEKRKKNRERIENAIKNNYADFYHWLPANKLYDGGYINFRKVITYSPKEFEAEFGDSHIKVQEYFVKNILNRFSAYYARQGQPDFDFKSESKALIDRVLPE